MKRIGLEIFRILLIAGMLMSTACGGQSQASLGEQPQASLGEQPQASSGEQSQATSGGQSQVTSGGQSQVTSGGQSQASLVEYYPTVDDLIRDSPVIVSGVVDSENQEFVYSGVTFALTKFKVTSVLRGTVTPSIEIIQTKADFDPLIKRGENMVLFLGPFHGPQVQAQGAYRIRGLFQGQFRIDNGTLVKAPDSKMIDNGVLANIETLKARIDAVPYAPSTKRPTPAG